jgi:hypothetical protein
MRKLSRGAIDGRLEILAISMAFGLAIAGLLYFNWLIAVSRSVLPQ